MTTNSALGEQIGLSHSGASRMRRGERTASFKTLIRLHESTGIPMEDWVRAASEAQAGDKTRWIALMVQAYGVDGNDDPDAVVDDGAVVSQR